MYKKPTAQELKAKLTPEQYRCTQEEGTERPFQNAYWDNERDGVYVDVVSGEPLFVSLDQFDSGSGWPSFSKPLVDSALATRVDRRLGVERVEVRSAEADSHLGHVFDDGPGPTGMRYCINSAALLFIPVESLMEKRLGHYLFLFANSQNWEVATLSGGCFWGMEELFQELPGVIETQVGYAGGETPRATYEQVKKGNTGHAESIQILFDPKKTSFENLLLFFFKAHDPTTLNQQGNDKGTQYRSVIFYANDNQKKTAHEIKARVDQSGKWGKPTVTQILPSGAFYRAEDDHQKYLDKNPGGYTCHFIRDLNF